MGDDRAERYKRLSSFGKATIAGTGLTRSKDDRGRRLDDAQESNDFSKSGLADAVSSLNGNLRRLQSHAQLPYAVFNYGRRFQEFYSVLIDQQTELNETDSLGLTAASNESLMNWMLGIEEHYTTIGRITVGTHVAGFATYPAFGMRDRTQLQLQSFYASLIIEAWTVFESLSEDLWEAALNKHPTILGVLQGLPRSKFLNKSRPTREAAPAPTSTVKFDDLQESGFDVKSKMGTIRKQQSGISFRSLNGIRDAYHRAFSRQHKSIDEILDDEGLQYAAAVRNLLIHKQGVVDSEFTEQTAKVSNAERLSNGSKLELTGELCGHLADSCRCCAVRLVNAVHGWIIGHPD